MPICKLCKINEANKTGSHNVPFFLMRSVDNEIGKRARNKELGFKISGNDVKGYFGQSVLREKLVEVFGELPDEELENRESSIIEDYIFCKSCEDKFGEIESGYAPTLTKIGEGVYNSSGKAGESLIFWIGIFWRVSVSDEAAFKMQKKDENKLWLLLNHYMNHQDAYAEVIQYQEALGNIGYKIIRSPGYAEKFNTGSFTIHLSHRQPYCMLLGEFAVFLYMKKTHLNGIQQSFYTFEKDLPLAPVNTTNKDEEILSLNHDEFSKRIDSAAHHMADNRKRSMNEFLDSLHVVWGGETKRMHKDVKEEIFNHLAYSNEKLGKKYTNEDLFRSAFEVLSKYNKPID